MTDTTRKPGLLQRLFGEAGATAPPEAPPAAPPADPHAAAAAARDARDWPAAARWFRVLVDANEQDVVSWIWLGHAHREQMQLDPALEAYAQASALAPHDWSIHTNIGHVQRMLGDAEGALAAYEAALHAEPAAEEPALAAIAMRRVIAEGRRLPRQDQAGAYALVRAADEARDARDWATAALRYRAYLELQPEDAEGWIQLGHAENESRRPRAAREAYERAAELAPGMPEAWLHAGHGRKLTGDLAGAREAYARVLELEPGHFDARRELRESGLPSALPRAMAPAPQEGLPAPAAGGLVFCTIASANYLARVLVLHDSALEHYPEARFVLCVADSELPADADLPSSLEVVAAADLGIADFTGFAFRYDQLEFCTALKPWLLRLLLARLGFGAAVYLDPDMLVLARAPQLLERLWRDASLVLTPHLRKPATGRFGPNDLSILRAGTFNLGFLGVAQRPEALQWLDWWAAHLAEHCLNRPEEGLFVDQRFMDLLPGFTAAAHIDRHPGLNLAYWNLPEHRLEQHGQFWSVDGEPVQVMHFSGFDPGDTTILSRHTALFRPIADPALRGLCEHYAALLAARGEARWRGVPYGYGRYASGAPIPALARRFFADRLAGSEADPFATVEIQMAETEPPGLPRALHYLWQSHRFARDAFDINRPEGVAALRVWAERGGFWRAS